MTLRILFSAVLTLLLVISVSCKGSGTPTVPDDPDAVRNVISWGSPGHDKAETVAVDCHGNVYVTGGYYLSWDGGIHDVDPEENIDPHMLDNGRNFFLSKYDPSGNLLWSRVWENPDGSSRTTDIACDSQGNVHLLVEFRGTGDIDPGPEIQMVSSPRDEILGVLRFDQVGNLQWWFSLSDTSDFGGYFRDCEIEIDGAGNISLSGIFYGEVDFDPGPIEDIRSSGIYEGGGGVVLIQPDPGFGGGGNGDSSVGFPPPRYNPALFLCRYDSQGRYQWAVTWEYEYLRPCGMSASGPDGVYMTGSFADLMDFDPGEGVDEYESEYGSRSYLIYLDHAGNYGWVRIWEDRAIEFNSISTDQTGRIYLAGVFYGSVNMEPYPGNGTSIFEPIGTRNACLVALDQNGNYQWARAWSGESGYAYGREVAADEAGNIWVIGTFEPEVDFDPGPGEEIRDLSDWYGWYISRFDRNGDFRWVRVWSSFRYGPEYRLSVGQNQSAWVAGAHAGPLTFGSIDERPEPVQDDYECTLFKFPPDGVW